MARTRPPYPAALREQIVELARAGRSPAELSREFDPTAQSIAHWMRFLLTTMTFLAVPSSTWPPAPTRSPRGSRPSRASIAA